MSHLGHTHFGQSYFEGGLDYQTSEQNRLSQITAEIFVTDGLDSAINIDRESFNYSHPHFLYIQKWLHRAVRLLINKNKSMAKAHLDEERRTVRAVEKRDRVVKAVSIWDERRGDESDPPISEIIPTELPGDVGGVEIEWATDAGIQDNAKAAAIAIVLEAYGVLGQLSSGERARLIRDLLKVLSDD